jgi:hypothetical protein
METEIKTFKKASKKEFELMSVQERKEYLNRFYDFINGTDRDKLAGGTVK